MSDIVFTLPGYSGRRLVLRPGDYVLRQPNGSEFVAVVRKQGDIVVYSYGTESGNFKTRDYPGSHGWDRRNGNLEVIAENPNPTATVPVEELRRALAEGGNLMALQHKVQDLLDRYDPDMREVPIKLTVRDLRELASGRVPETVKQGAQAGLDELK